MSGRAIRLFLIQLAIFVHGAPHGRAQQQHRPPHPPPPTFDDFDLTEAETYPRLAVPSDAGPTIEEVSPSSPRVYLIHNALTLSECDHIRSVAKRTLRRSYVGTGGQGMRGSDRRTSESTFVITGSIFKTKVMRRASARIANVTGLDVTHFADLQVNRYRPGGKYEPHVDWAPSNVAEQEWTALLCLSTVAEDQGGETVFPRSNIKVRGQEGMAIVFRNVIDPGLVDLDSLHGGAPLKYGEKWNANQWVLVQRVPFSRRISLPVLLLPWGGDPPPAIMRLRNALMARFGGDRGFRLFNAIANTALIVIMTTFTGVTAGITKVFIGEGLGRRAQYDD